MSIDLVDAYVRAIEDHDLAAVVALFGDHGVVAHPILGELPASVFYEQLLGAVVADSIEIRDIFVSTQSATRIAVWFDDDWETTDGSTFTSLMVLIFELGPDGRIDRLTVMFDTEPVRHPLPSSDHPPRPPLLSSDHPPRPPSGDRAG